MANNLCANGCADTDFECNRWFRLCRFKNRNQLTHDTSFLWVRVRTRIDFSLISVNRDKLTVFQHTMKPKRSWWCCWKVIIQIHNLRRWDLAWICVDGLLLLFSSLAIVSRWNLSADRPNSFICSSFYDYFLLTCLTIIHNDRSSENHIYSVSARTHLHCYLTRCSSFASASCCWIACSVAYTEN